MEEPKDFIRPGHMRPNAWFRTGVTDEATVFQHRLKAVDLWALADWCVKAAKYIEASAGQQAIVDTKPKPKKSA